MKRFFNLELFEKLIFIFFSIFLVRIFAFEANAVVTQKISQADENLDAGISLIVANNNFVQLEIIVPLLEQTSYLQNNQTLQQLTLDGYGSIGEIGYPDLPKQSIYIALPPNAEPVVSILETNNQIVQGITALPAKQITLADVDVTNLDRVPTSEISYPHHSQAYETDALFPQEIVTIEEVTWLRDQRVAKLAIYPIQANTAQNQIIYHTELAVQIDFVYSDEQPTTHVMPRPENGAFETILKNQVVNYEQGKLWRQAPPFLEGTSAVSPCHDENAFRIETKDAGIHTLSYDRLSEAGFIENAAVENILMCYEDQEVAIQVQDTNGDSIFNNGDAIIFYAEPFLTHDTERNVYWLTVDNTVLGERMSVVNGDPVGASVPATYEITQHLEENTQYWSQYPSGDLTDHWYWGSFLETSGNNRLDMPFVVEDLATTVHDVNITTSVWGFKQEEAHRYEVLLNDVQIGVGTFFGSGIRDNQDLLTLTVPSSHLVEGNNTLGIRLLLNDGGASHAMLVDWAEVTYERYHVAQDDRLDFWQTTAGIWQLETTGFTDQAHIYDVTDPIHPVQINTSVNGSGTVHFQQTVTEPSHYVLTADTAYYMPVNVSANINVSNWRDTTNQADYIIITDPLFDEALAPLIEHRSQFPETAHIVTVYVQDIFDEFSYGRYDTEAIRTFLQYTYTSWQSPKPAFVLLAGEGSYDHRNLAGENTATNDLVPVYLLSGVDSEIGETAADNQYVEFIPENGVAEMLLGRLPALSVTEMETMVDKILAYESVTVDPLWKGNHLFLVDNGYEVPTSAGNPCTRDGAGDFFEHVNDIFLSDHFPFGSQTLSRLYYAPPECYPNELYPTYEHYYAPTTIELNNRFRDHLNENGSQFMSYIGHSSTSQWSSPSFLKVSDIVNLTNAGKTPISLPMTCLSGLYHFTPSLYASGAGQSLEEALLKHPNGGTVASYAPTGLQVQHGHDYLLSGFYDAIYAADEPATLLGEAIMGAKMELAANGSARYQDLQDTFMLLGDPAMQLMIFDTSNRNYLPTLMTN